MKVPTLEDFVRDKGAELKAVLDPSKNSPNVEKLAGVVVIGLRWMLDGMLQELATVPDKRGPGRP